MTQGDLAYALRAFPMLERTEGARVGEWERGAAPKVGFYVVAAIAEATGVGLDFFSGVSLVSHAPHAPLASVETRRRRFVAVSAEPYPNLAKS